MFDPWRQWQNLIAGSLGADPATQTRAARDKTSGFGPFVDAAERYAAAARSFMESVAGAAAAGTGTAAGTSAGAAAGTSAPAAGAAAGIFSDFLREQFADFQMPWSAGISAGNGAARAFSLDAPALGATREQQLRLQRMANAGFRIEDAQRRLQRLWSDTLREAATAFATRLMPPPVPNQEELRKLYDAWIDCAEDAYGRTARTEEFCNALAEFVNASSAWRREVQADIEHWAKLLDLPTRGEINTLTRRLKSVEQQLRAARGEVRPADEARKHADSTPEARAKPDSRGTGAVVAARRAKRAPGKSKS